MANGTTRLALAQMQLDRKQQDEQAYLLKLSDKGKKQPKVALKYPSSHNHSK